jgi:hypothetical protein
MTKGNLALAVGSGQSLYAPLNQEFRSAESRRGNSITADEGGDLRLQQAGGLVLDTSEFMGSVGSSGAILIYVVDKQDDVFMMYNYRKCLCKIQEVVSLLHIFGRCEMKLVHC